MKRTKLRYLFAPLWILNMVIMFGLIYPLISNEAGEVSTRIMALVSLPLLFSIYLIKDILLYKRALFLRITGYWMLFYAAVYIVLIIKNFNISSVFYLILFVPTLLSGIKLAKTEK